MSNHVSTASTTSTTSTTSNQSNRLDNTATDDELSKPSVNNEVAPTDLPPEPDIDALLDIADEAAVTWVRQQDGLKEVIDALATCGRVALDTEFIKRDTYYPRLALVQLNVGDHIYLLDAPQLQLAELWQALMKVDVAIWHACGEDLGIFYLLSGCPPLTNIFDTQIALSYLTGQLQMGYQQALDDQLDMHIDKEQSQSDWLQRPLSDEQEQYAIDDVRFLPALYLSLEY